MQGKFGYLLLFLFFFTSLAQGQDLLETDESELETVLIEGLLSEDASSSLILDNSRTKIGRDFYEIFYQDWSEIAADTSQVTAVMRGLNPDDFIITIDELPSPVSGSVVVVSINEQIVWQQFIQPRSDGVFNAVDSATELLRQYFQNYQEIQKQLETEDMKGTGIF